MKSSQIIALVAGLYTAGMAQISAAQQSVIIEPLNSSVGIGEQFSVELAGKDSKVVLIGGGLSLKYDPAVLRVDSVKIDDGVWEFIPANYPRVQIENSSGTIDLGFLSFRGVPPGDYSIATATFTALAAGSSPLTLGPSADIVYPWVDEDAKTITSSISFGSAQVNVAAVPEVSAVWLMLAGLGVLGAFTRKARS